MAFFRVLESRTSHASRRILAWHRADHLCLRLRSRITASILPIGGEELAFLHFGGDQGCRDILLIALCCVDGVNHAAVPSSVTRHTARSSIRHQSGTMERSCWGAEQIDLQSGRIHLRVFHMLSDAGLKQLDKVSCSSVFATDPDRRFASTRF